ncbi:MAG: HNH endonuclease [Bdellovibrionales bacterium CG10_big_fil_rev_8_21_14_0_10_45_34]|nr:MAG: HNH endonuclease [Bdellovibrionales bacterium CG10_big_fil_rev_8_21_14_0_10_45_34]
MAVKTQKEKQKARELRQSQWWKQQLAKGVCFYCEKTFAPNELTMDHKIPLSRGGRSTKGNIVPCCKDCNNKKTYLTPAEIVLAGLQNDAQKKGT